jgi:two-component system, OmpR family, response regulator ChvI
MKADSNEKDNQIARATTNTTIDNINSLSMPKRKRLLVVDDEPDITSVLRRGLEQYGFAVDTFNDPVETLSHFKVGYYDLLLLDISMPKMNGFELYNEMAKIDNKVKVCFMTAFEIYRDEFKRLFPKLSLNCFANKPISIKTLANLLKIELEVITT